MKSRRFAHINTSVVGLILVLVFTILSSLHLCLSDSHGDSWTDPPHSLPTDPKKSNSQEPSQTAIDKHPSNNQAQRVNACENKNPGMVISIPGRTYGPAITVVKKLNERGCKIEGPYPRSDQNENPNTSEIRYFHKLDQVDAQRASDYIKKELHIELVPVYLSGHSEEPKGQLEIWIK